MGDDEHVNFVNKLYPALMHDNEILTVADCKDDDIQNLVQERWGSDKKALLKVMGNMTPEQRMFVPILWEDRYGKSLKKHIAKEIRSGTFGTALKLLAVDPVEAECDLIDIACKGIGSNTLLLMTILCGRSNEEMDILKKRYYKLRTKDLGRVVDRELSGNLEKIVVNCMQGSMEDFDEDFHTPDKAKEDAITLYKMGQGKWLGTDEVAMFKIICSAPVNHLREINMIYADKYGYTLYKALEKELGGRTRDAALFLLGMKLKPFEEIAKLIHKACKGLGTNELLLTSILIRYQYILPSVEEAHQELYDQSVEDRIRSEVSGNYRKLLLEILTTELDDDASFNDDEEDYMDSEEED